MSSRSLKVSVIGDSHAGKTALRSRYLHDSFQTAYISTIGADFVSKTVEVAVPVPIFTKEKVKQRSASNDDQQATSKSKPFIAKFQTETIKVTLSIWDTAGQERFKSLGSAFYRGSDAVIIAFDLSVKGSLARTINWYNDFCRLGDVGYEGERMNSRQLKQAREQRDRFCWVGVGCKGDLLQDLNKKHTSTQAPSESDSPPWKGVGWSEARGWFDTMIPRFLPEGEEEKQGYPNIPEVINNAEAALPYKVGQEAPARPEDVLSRPTKTSITSQGADTATSEAGTSLGRPLEAGLAPGTAPAPGSMAMRKSSMNSQPQSHQRSNSQARWKREKRKSIRSIEVWQGNQSASLESETQSVPTRAAKDGSQRSRYDSATSVGGPPSVYYSIRGSTVFSQSPAGGEGGSSLNSTDTNTTTMQNRRPGSRNISTSSQSRMRKASNLSEIQNDDDEEQQDTKLAPTLSARTDESSSDTIRGDEAKDEEQEAVQAANEDEDDALDSTASIPTVPSGDPIPFPSSDDLDDEDEEAEKPIRRGTSRRRPIPTQTNGLQKEGEVGRKAKVIAEETQKDLAENNEEQRLAQESGETFDKRATLYSARPSSISSTIKSDDEEDEQSHQQNDLNNDNAQSGESFRNEVMEQGFRLFFTSAKDGEGIDDVFEHIARRVAIRWKLEEWEEQMEAERLGGKGTGQARTAPPTDEEVERERIKRAIKISSGKATGGCCT